MNKSKKKCVLLLLLICMVVLFGCTRTKIIDKISIVHVFGFDQADNGELVGSALFPDYTKSKDGDQIQSLEEQAPTSSLVVSKMAAHTSTPVEIAKIRVLLFGKSYAESGIGDMVKRLMMTPQLGTHIQIAVSTHSAKETLNTFKKEKSLTLTERILHNMQGQTLPNMNLHVFLNHFYGEGLDAYVPMLTIDKKGTVIVEGIGVFKDDKFKLHLNPKQTALFSFIKDNRPITTFEIDPEDKKHQRDIIIVKSNRSKKKWDWNQEKEELHLHLQLAVSLTQYPDRYNVDNPEDIRKIKEMIVGKIEKGIEDLLATLKEKEVDPIGIGNIVRSKDKTWEEESFYKQYPTLPIHVDVNLEILHSGLEG
ncbi:Ger(x)C family spore germination protein [Bacillus dakarensis]|uniref:Ger(x)C family spore germination protein n=1 Tax=Robertmurraya dakarensis TaxID=1926278 RepID=UPI00098122FE|nr:Ger(x)C family spore germination protein [Bacillus dakarensis]